MNDLHTFLIIMVASLVTAGIRFLPFLIFRGNGKQPEMITYLSSVLPYAIIGMLVVYCLRNVNFMAGNRGLPELIASLGVVGIHKWKKNTLLSVGGGTLLYMVLIQFIF